MKRDYPPLVKIKIKKRSDWSESPVVSMLRIKKEKGIVFISQQFLFLMCFHLPFTFEQA